MELTISKLITKNSAMKSLPVFYFIVYVIFLLLCSSQIARETEALLAQLGSNDDINSLLRGFAGVKDEPAPANNNNNKGGEECQALRRENQALKQVQQQKY